MKREILGLALALLMTCSLSIAQNNKSVEKKICYVSRNLNVKKFHNSHDLEKLRKNVLIKIYLERVHIFTELVPYLGLKAKPGMELVDLTVPYTKKRQKRVKLMMKRKSKYFMHLDGSMKEILVYSDSKDLIWGIIFLDVLIGHMETHLQTPD